MTDVSLSFGEALEALSAAATFGMNPSLATITAMCEELGRPQDAFAAVQITGTNGKTSTARLTQALLAAEGVRTGLYTSPELERYPERIEVSGQVVSDREFADAIAAAVRVSGGGATEFELLTAAALWHFRRAGVEVAVLEVGLGGRWDATSVVSPAVAVVTGVGLDHMAVLGDTVEQIAREKAAIIRQGCVAVLGPGTAELRELFGERAARVGARVVTPRAVVRRQPAGPSGETVLDVDTGEETYETVRVALPAYQADNIATAVAAAREALGRPLRAGAIRRALVDAKLPGRFELVLTDPPVIVDGSHNPQAARVLAGAIRDAWCARTGGPHVLLGVLADKDTEGIVAALAPVASGFSVTAPRSPRALGAPDLAAVVTRVTGVAPGVFGDVESALETLLPGVPNGLVITGSLTTAGQARAALRVISGID